MNEKLYRETFSQIHASENTITEVMKMTHTEKKARKPLRAAVVLAAALALVITACAAGLIRLPLGRNVGMHAITLSLDSLGQDSPTMEDAFGNALVMPDMQRRNMSQTQVTAILGDAVYAAEGTFTQGDNTYILDTFFMDENGMGILTYTMTSEHGLDIYDAGYGQINGGGVELNIYQGDTYGNDNFCDSTALQIGRRSENKVRVLEKFGSFAPYEGNGVSIGRMETSFGHLLPEKHLTTLTGSDDRGHTASVSPLGLVVTWNEPGEPTINTAELHFADGTTYTVKSDGVWNTDLSYLMTNDDGSFLNVSYMFADLVDISALQSVHVEGHSFLDGTKTPFVRDYTF